MLDILTPSTRKLIMSVIVLSVLFLILDIILQLNLILTERAIHITDKGWITCPPYFETLCSQTVREVDLSHAAGIALISYVIACFIETAFPGRSAKATKSKSRSKRRK